MPSGEVIRETHRKKGRVASVRRDNPGLPPPACPTTAQDTAIEITRADHSFAITPGHVSDFRHSSIAARYGQALSFDSNSGWVPYQAAQE
jgi:hypothetical protein